ncbi:ABC transporter, ATPbinding domain containing protein [Acanthamoeba castellanii str. Neff]|uniref:ABC transporter, ATPbinding domain containing protein n=1 Tax=Acanthamoeba castellanii (strain ATCC 30010 / Neff) TaxID=1257118 RepID=L8GIJ1_ACACF|nr:ABC transporter, ATPbinding domain containing protein [Acanthamoeba castellanii str. Neff]ELR12905.1 ABC transporter, ATPbinding domain containing protein [Acanthamoeba castellanii str. Neff]
MEHGGAGWLRSVWKAQRRLWASVVKRLNGLPIIIFYRYLYENNKPLLAQGLTVNYLLPMVLEILPFWWLSSRKLGNRLRKTRIKLNHNMATGKSFLGSLVMEFFLLTIFHAILDTVKRHLQNRTAIENRLLIRRLVFERLLYSEMGEFEKLRTLDIEYRISADISQAPRPPTLITPAPARRLTFNWCTLSFFSFTLPQIVGSVYALMREGFELYKHRQHVDPLALAHPVLIGVVRKVMGYFKYHFIEKRQRDVIQKTRNKMSRLVSNALDGLADIQVNNLQKHQLHLLDQMIRTELANSLGFKTLVARTWNLFSNRNALEFVAEVYVVHQVMQRQQISHEVYGKIQHDIHRVFQLLKRVYGLFRITRNMLEFQKEVIELVNIPNFLEEHKKFNVYSEVTEFKELRVENIHFSYKADLSPALCFHGELVFEPGKQYAIVGQNRSGKSTLCKLICKLYQPDSGSLTLNGVPYSRISRISLRDYISYLSQKPFLFPGTIRDNIRIGNPNATEEQIYEAAEMAGVFAYGAAPSNEGVTAAGLRRTVSMNDIARRQRESRASSVEAMAASEATAATPLSNSGSAAIPSASTAAMDSPATTPAAAAASTSRDSLSPPAAGAGAASVAPRRPRTGTGTVLLGRAATIAQLPIPINLADEKELESEGSSSSTESLLHRAVNFVWEAETDYHSSAAKKKQKKQKKKSVTIREDPFGPGGWAEGRAGGKSVSEAAILDMKVTARGNNISGGFAQSIALARVFVKTQAKIIILDEALGQMDAYKKRGMVVPALTRFVKKWNMTLIIISHDMVSIEGVHKIYVLHMGELVHQGSHQELLEQKAPLYLQLLGIDDPDAPVSPVPSPAHSLSPSPSYNSLASLPRSYSSAAAASASSSSPSSLTNFPSLALSPRGPPPPGQ